MNFTVYVNEIEDEELRKEVREFISNDDIFNVYLDGRDWIIVEGKTQKYELDVWKLDAGRKTYLRGCKIYLKKSLYRQGKVQPVKVGSAERLLHSTCLAGIK